MVNSNRRVINIRPKNEEWPTPQCYRRVDLSSYHEHYIIRRKHRCKELGYNPALCTRQSSYIVDGEYLCTVHAKQIALKILIREEI